MQLFTEGPMTSDEDKRFTIWEAAACILLPHLPNLAKKDLKIGNIATECEG